MRTAIVPGVIAAVVAAMAAGGCAAASTGPDGAWTACGNVAHITAVQVRRAPEWAPLPPARPNGPAARRLFHDFCVIAGHPDDSSSGGGWCACPSSPVPLYRGVFYAGHRRLAIFDYEAGYLGLYVGPAQMQTAISGPAAAAAPASLDADFVAVLGLSPDSVYNPPRRPPPRPPPPRLTVASTAAVAGRPGWIAAVSGTARCSGGERATLGINLDESSASGQSGGKEMTIACDGHRHGWSAAVRVSFPTGPRGTYWIAPGSGDVTLFLYDLGGPLDFYTGALARPARRGIRFVVTRQASADRPSTASRHVPSVTGGRLHRQCAGARVVASCG
jgi:hypothetical protein